MNPLGLQADTERGSPLYYQLQFQLRQKIERGIWMVGEKTPTIEELMSDYGVSRATVRNAMELLEAEGLISRSRGRGTVIVRRPEDDKWLMLPSDWLGLVTHIDKLHTKVINESESFDQFASTDSTASASGQYWLVSRINFSEPDKPYSITEIALKKSIFDLAPDAFRKGAVLPALHRVAPKAVHHATQSMAIGAADSITARKLALSVSAPVAEVVREATDKDHVLIYYAKVLYPAKHLKISTRLM